MRVPQLSVQLCDLRTKNFQDISPIHTNRNSLGSYLGEQIKTPDHSSSMCNPMKLKMEKKEENDGDSGFKLPLSDDEKKDKDFKLSLSDDEKKDKDFKLSETSDSDSEGAEKFHIYKVGSRKKYKKKQWTSPRKNSKKLNSYEEMIARNRAERLAFLQSIKMDEVKAGLSEAVEMIKEKKKKPQQVKRVYNQVEKTSPPVLRKSRRLAKMDIDLSEDAIYQRALKEAEAVERQNQVVEKIPSEMSFKTALRCEDFYESYLKDVDVSQNKEAKFFSYDRSAVKNLTLDENNIAKVTPDRISALAWYPSSENLIVAAGSKYGNLGIWNVKSDSSPYLFKIHYEGITNLKFNPYNPVQMFTSSYDGILRCGDFVKYVFEQVYESDKAGCTYFDFLSEKTFLVAHRNGQVAIVDNRDKKRNCEKQHACHDYSVKTVNVHPVNKSFFVSADNKGTIRLWDLRKLQKQPIADITHHKRCVQSAFFSPVTGNTILATSADDTVSLFDSTNLTKDIKLKQFIKHNNYTGRWLSVFRATWLPNSDEAFVIGSMQDPRRIEVFDKNLDVYHIVTHPNLTTISSTNAFHPCVSALAGANSSGKVFVFT